jgi:hypothetical protein
MSVLTNKSNLLLLPFVKSEKGLVRVHRFRAPSCKMVRVGVVGYGHLGQYLADKILKDGKIRVCASSLDYIRLIFDLCFICRLDREECALSVDYTVKI